MATAFDTMWAIMLALKEASVALPSHRPLEYNVNETIGSGLITSTIQSKLRNVSFEGLTVIASYLFFYSSAGSRSAVYAFYIMMQLVRGRGEVLGDDTKNLIYMIRCIKLL